MRLGPAGAVTADIYGGGVTYHGKIVGLGRRQRGSAFALLPPQNATWQLDQDRAARAGARRARPAGIAATIRCAWALSVAVSVNVHDTSGPSVASFRPLRTMTADSADDGTAQADALIRRILSENGG
ncbi:MAG: hypothetical protein WDN03_06520 [Rhizomicrobium sp.]